MGCSCSRRLLQDATTFTKGVWLMDKIAKLRALGFREEEIERFVAMPDDLSDNSDVLIDELSEQQEDIDEYDIKDMKD